MTQFPKINITHVPTGKSVSFDSYIERFSDNFNSEWEPNDVFGRMDDIRNFKRTTRTIELGWTVVAESATSGATNYENCSTLMAMLYPVYESTDITTATASPIDIDVQSDIKAIEQGIVNLEETFGASSEQGQYLKENVASILTSVKDTVRQRSTSNIQTRSRKASIMNAPPIFKINFANLIRNGAKEDKQLYGTIEGFKYEPDMDMGFFIVGEGDEQMMYPKVISLSFAFTVIHTAPLGWEYDGTEYKLRNSDFPFYKKK